MSSKTKAHNGLTFIQKNPSTQTRIEVSEYQGRTFVNIRDWVKRKGDDEHRPTKNGMSVPLDLYSAFKDMIASFEPNEDDAKKGDGKERILYAVFQEGEKVLDSKSLVKSFTHCVEQKLAVSSLDKLKPARGFVVYAAKVEGNKVKKVKRYARYHKSASGVRTWKKFDE